MYVRICITSCHNGRSKYVTRNSRRRKDLAAGTQAPGFDKIYRKILTTSFPRGIRRIKTSLGVAKQKQKTHRALLLLPSLMLRCPHSISKSLGVIQDALKRKTRASEVFAMHLLRLQWMILHEVFLGEEGWIATYLTYFCVGHVFAGLSAARNKSVI